MTELLVVNPLGIAFDIYVPVAVISTSTMAILSLKTFDKLVFSEDFLLVIRRRKYEDN